LLPTNLDLDIGMVSNLVNGSDITPNTPADTIKVSEPSPSWTEVVRKGKTRNKSSKIDKYDMRVLEY
jgi:hypothetical protein